MAPVRVTAPATSNLWRGAVTSLSSAISLIPAASRMAEKITGAKNTHRQPIADRSPPMTRPREKPADAVPA